MQHSLIQRFIALVLLMVYAITGTSALTAAMTLFAAFDDSHAVIVSQSENGTRLTLHHRGQEFTPAIADHEHAVARLIVCLCKSSETGDHQFNSKRSDAITGSERNDVARSVKQAPAVNAAATFQLGLFAHYSARDMIRVSGLKAVPVPSPQGIGLTLAAVRLLI